MKVHFTPGVALGFSYNATTKTFQLSLPFVTLELGSALAPVEPPKKKRGRPRKTQAATPAIDPRQLPVPGTEAETPK